MTGILQSTTLVLALLGGFAAGEAPDATTASASDLTALERALERIGEGIPADPRAGRSPAHRGMYNAMEFGAQGDGVTDDTAAIQKALDAAAADGGGVVQLPAGQFLIRTRLTLPRHVTLEGVWRKPNRGEPADKGTVLLAVEGKGSEDGPPFIALQENSCLSGVTIFYPEQIRANPPHAYPWTIQGKGDDCGILNVTIVNAYQAVDFGTHACGRHYIDGLYAYPFKMGLYVNQCYDVGRLNNIHFWPFWDLDPDSPLWAYTRAHGTAFKFGRTDGELATNLFCIFYNVGMHLVGGPIPQPGSEPRRVEYQGGCAAFTNVYLDVTNCALQVDDSMENTGYSFTNCFFMSKVQVGPRNRGPIRFSGCGFWATDTLDSHAILKGMASVLFEACHFANWDRQGAGAPCIDADARRVLITGCDFLTIRPGLHKVTLGPNVREAVVTSNLMQGGVSIVNNAPKYADVQIGLNAGNPVDACIRRWTILGPFPNPDIAPAPEGDAPTRAGFDTDYLAALGGEAQAVLKPGTQVEYKDERGQTRTVTANNVSTNDAARLDFARRLKANRGVAYAYAEFEADEAGPIDIFFGSADSAKVWVNGELVHSVWTPGRLFAPGQDVFTIQAKPGVNRILVKVEDGSGAFWEFMVEARDPVGNALRILPARR
jgi:hypothetical protein